MSFFANLIKSTKELLSFQGEQPISYQQYIVLEKISSDSITKYYRCRYRNEPKEVCVKICRRRKKYRFNGEEEIIHEINLLKEINNEHIIHIQREFINNNYAGYEMELTNGGDLLQWVITNGSIPIGQFHLVCIQLLEALNYLNSNNIIHHNITLHSVLITRQNEFNSLKLTHFGQSFKTDEAITDQHTLLDPHYVAPEIFRHYLYTHKADIWSLGVLLFKSFTNQFPFESPLNNSNDLIKTILRGKVRFADDLPKTTITILLSMLNPNVDERPSAMETIKLCGELPQD